MSRVATQPQTKTTGTPSTTTHPVAHEKIAQRAYEKWMKRGCPHGTHMQDWTEAEAELRNESGSAMHGTSTPTRR